MGDSVNFLEKRSVHSLRKEINNIIDSYNNAWDILCELCQNSFDAIVRYNKKFGEDSKRHEISIEINVRKRMIRITDTGIGIEAKKVKEIIAPNGTDKEDEADSIGEKGVGLTYTIFSCNAFRIETRNESSYFKGHIDNASAWRNKQNDTIPFLVIDEERETESTKDTYTTVELENIEMFVPQADDLFGQTVEVLQYILRTRTVIGYLKGAYGEKNVKIDVRLTYVDYRDLKTVYPVDLGYWLPDDFVGNNKINFDDFKARAATYDDKQKTKKLRGKALTKIGAVTKSNRKINYYCFFAPSRNLWKEICEKNKLYLETDSGEKEYLLTGGIYVATKGMPTGIVIEPPSSGFSGYWNNYFMIIEDDAITFDLGRKTVPSRTKGMIKEVAKQLFTEMLPYVKYVTSDPAVSTRTNATVQQVAKANTYTAMLGYADLKLDKINYLKHPNEQEAAVVSIFHELVGAGILKGYYSLSTGYKQTYDLWATYRIKSEDVGENFQDIAVNGIIEMPCVIEFKYQAESIINDLSNDIKFFNDMDLLVCWDFNEQKFASNSIEVEMLPKEDVLFYGANYKMIWPGAYNLGAASEKPVLSLRQFIENYVKNQNS